MKNPMIRTITLTMAILSCCFSAMAQDQPASGKDKAAEMAKMMYESIDSEVEKQTERLGLADWQVFKLDSMLTHNYSAQTEEMQRMSAAKVSNLNMYIEVQDKWAEACYNGYRAFLNDEQWAKYEKQGAAKAKKSRDKRVAKAKAQTEKLNAKLKK